MEVSTNHHIMTMDNCSPGELIAFNFNGPNMIAITGNLNGGDLPIVILSDDSDDSDEKFHKLPFATVIDPYDYNCISFGKVWQLEVIPTPADEIISSVANQKLGTVFLNGELTALCVGKKTESGIMHRVMDLEAMTIRTSFNKIVAACKNWNIWLTKDDMHNAKKKPFIKFRAT